MKNCLLSTKWHLLLYSILSYKKCFFLGIFKILRTLFKCQFYRQCYPLQPSPLNPSPSYICSIPIFIFQYIVSSNLYQHLGFSLILNSGHYGDLVQLLDLHTHNHTQQPALIAKIDEGEFYSCSYSCCCTRVTSLVLTDLELVVTVGNVVLMPQSRSYSGYSVMLM